MSKDGRCKSCRMPLDGAACIFDECPDYAQGHVYYTWLNDTLAEDLKKNRSLTGVVARTEERAREKASKGFCLDTYRIVLDREARERPFDDLLECTTPEMKVLQLTKI